MGGAHRGRLRGNTLAGCIAHHQRIGYIRPRHVWHAAYHGSWPARFHHPSASTQLDDGASQPPMYVTCHALVGMEDYELRQTEPAMGSYLLQLKRLQRCERSYMTSTPERKVSKCRHRILNSTGDIFFDTRRMHLDQRVAEDILAHYDVRVYGHRCQLQRRHPHPIPQCHTNACTKVHPTHRRHPKSRSSLRDLTNRIRSSSFRTTEGQKRDSWRHKNATPTVWGGTEDDTIREVVDVLAQGQKAHARKRLLMVYVANKNRDWAIATLRVEHVERPSLRAANRYQPEVTKWTGTANAK